MALPDLKSLRLTPPTRIVEARANPMKSSNILEATQYLSTWNTEHEDSLPAGILESWSLESYYGIVISALESIDTCEALAVRLCHGKMGRKNVAEVMSDGKQFPASGAVMAVAATRSN